MGRIAVALTLGVSIGVGLLPAQMAAAATQTVTNCNDSGAGSLRQAVIDVVARGTVDFSSSLGCPTITLTSGRINITKDLTITGPGAANLAVSGNKASQVFFVEQKVSAKITGLTITNGLANGSGDVVSSNGGGIANWGKLWLVQTTISNNTSTYVSNGTTLGDGGGIETFEGTLRVNNSTISGNSAGFEGGGIYNTNKGTVTIIDTTISNNSAQYGGGIDNSGKLHVSGGSNSGNSASSQGGGIYNSLGATATVDSTPFSGNSSGSSGGGIYNSGTLNVYLITFSNNSSTLGGGIANAGTVNEKECTYSGNTASAFWGGGAIKNFLNSTYNVSSAAISDNSAPDGGGIANDGNLTVASSTISHNTATDDGGGIANDGNLALKKTSVTADTASNDGGGIYNTGSGTVKLTHSSVTDDQPDDCDGVTC